MSYRYYCIEQQLHLKYGYKTVKDFLAKLPSHGYDPNKVTWSSAADKEKAITTNTIYSVFVPAYNAAKADETIEKPAHYMASSMPKLLTLMGVT